MLFKREKSIMKEVIIMTNYREILRLSSLGFSNRNIALSVPCSRNTVAKVLKRAQELKVAFEGLKGEKIRGLKAALKYAKEHDIGMTAEQIQRAMNNI